MIKCFSSLFKAHLLLFTTPNHQQLTHLTRFFFARSPKNSQLILHTPQQVDNMIAQKQKKTQIADLDKKAWRTNVKSDLFKFRISLVGLPNCGKSSLFNCLIGQRLAIVDKHYGTTRDRKEFDILNGLASVIDTPGVQTSLIKHAASNSNTLQEEIFKQTISAIHESHLILFVIDSKQPITVQQIQFAQYLKAFKNNLEIILICNKCDNLFDEGEVINEASKLGIPNMFTVSSEEGTGVLQLLNFINDRIPEEVRETFEKRRAKRIERFQNLIEKLKEDIEKYNLSKEFKIKEWQNDFRKINPSPENNEDLDEDNYQQFFVRPEEGFSNRRGAEIKNVKMKNTIKICMIGRPNVGKSTLINEIIGEDKMVVSDVPHTTRDSIRSKIQYKDRKIELIDTAGLNTPRIEQNDEEYLRKVQISTMIHVNEAHVVVYVMDSFSSFVIDDFAFIKKVMKEGRPLIIAVNKWEAVKQPFRYKAKNYLAKQIEKHLGQLHGNPLVFISAKMNTGLEQMMDKIIITYDKWNMRISTGLLNDWLDNFKKLENIPKDDKGHTFRLNYMIQARVRPPHFIFFVNSKNLFNPAYERFLMRNLANQFKMDGIPLRLTLRSSNNKENKYNKPKERKQSKLKQKMEQLKTKYGNFGL